VNKFSRSLTRLGGVGTHVHIIRRRRSTRGRQRARQALGAVSTPMPVHAASGPSSLAGASTELGSSWNMAQINAAAICVRCFHCDRHDRSLLSRLAQRALPLAGAETVRSMARPSCR
jgi:hypothetical protein